MCIRRLGVLLLTAAFPDLLLTVAILAPPTVVFSAPLLTGPPLPITVPLKIGILTHRAVAQVAVKIYSALLAVTERRMKQVGRPIPDALRVPVGPSNYPLMHRVN